jgi:hypothetical protein
MSRLCDSRGGRAGLESCCPGRVRGILTKLMNWGFMFITKQNRSSDYHGILFCLCLIDTPPLPLLMNGSLSYFLLRITNQEKHAFLGETWLPHVDELCMRCL